MATKPRKPSPAQIRALTYLIDVCNGREWSYDLLEVEYARTWRACEAAGWVTRDEYQRVLVTDVGRRAMADNNEVGAR